MKLIQFKESASQRVYDAYMLRCKRATRLLPARDSEEVLMEINSHIFEHLSAHPAGAEIDTLLDLLDRLGAPEETLRAIVADKKIAQAARSFNPVHLLQGLILNIGNGFIYVLLFMLMLFLASFPLLAVLKIFQPEKVGFFTTDTGGFSFGFADHPAQQHERLGGWFIPVMLVGALLLYYVIILLVKWTRQIKKQKIRLKTGLVALLCMLGTATGFSQGVTGDWQGKLKAGALELRVVFHVTGSGDHFSSTMDSPDQGAKGIVLSAVTYAHDTLRLALQSAQLTYAGVLQSDSVIIGTLEQGGQSFPLTLSRPTGVPVAARKPQDPVPPYPYLSERVHFTNEHDHIELAGTLTLPAKGAHFPAVVLITGSGPQNRDEELLGHRPFLVLSDYLTRQGIAVLRFDDRGVAESKGVFSTATTLDFSYDAEAALQYLRSRPEINADRIGLAGHSEGGLIAPMIAARSKAVAFIVLLAGPGLRGDSLLLLQQTLIAKASGVPDPTLKKAAALNRGALAIAAGPGDSVHMRQALQAYLATFLQQGNSDMIPPGTSDTSFVNSQIKTLMSPWMQYFLRYDPVPALEKVNCPVLAIGGDKDLQVPAAIDLHLIQMALAAAHNNRATITELPGLNHLFQTAATGSPREYAIIDETFSPVAMALISDWILRQ